MSVPRISVAQVLWNPAPSTFHSKGQIWDFTKWKDFFSGFKPTWIIPFYHRNKRKIRKSKLHQPTAFLFNMMFKWFINDIYTSKKLEAPILFLWAFSENIHIQYLQETWGRKTCFFFEVSIHVDMDGVNPHMPQASKDQSIRFVEAHPKKWQFWWGFEAQSKQTIWWEKCVSDFWLLFLWLDIYVGIHLGQWTIIWVEPTWKTPGRIVSNYLLKGKSVVCCSYIWIIPSLFTHVLGLLWNDTFKPHPSANQRTLSTYIRFLVSFKSPATQSFHPAPLDQQVKHVQQLWNQWQRSPYCWLQTKIIHQLIWTISHVSKRFIDNRWLFGISSIKHYSEVMWEMNCSHN